MRKLAGLAGAIALAAAVGACWGALRPARTPVGRAWKARPDNCLPGMMSPLPQACNRPTGQSGQRWKVRIRSSIIALPAFEDLTLSNQG